MNPLLVMRSLASTRTEFKIVLATLTVIVCLPVMVVFSLAHTSLRELSASAFDNLYQGPVSTTDLYEWGNCTYWASWLRQQAGDPIPNSWGNAATWATRAAIDGYVVDQIPSIGAIMQISGVANGLGHVAYVTNVDPLTGSWTISEMNVKAFDVVDIQTLPGSAALKYQFIHDKAIL